MEDQKKKYFLLKFIPAIDKDGTIKVMKVHEQYESEELWNNIVKPSILKGYDRRFKGSQVLSVIGYQGYDEAFIITFPEFIHDLRSSLDSYYSYIKEKDIEKKKEFQGELFTLDVSFKMTEEEKGNHIAFCEKKIEQRKKYKNKRLAKKKV